MTWDIGNTVYLCFEMRCDAESIWVFHYSCTGISINIHKSQWFDTMYSVINVKYEVYT